MGGLFHFKPLSPLGTFAAFATAQYFWSLLGEQQTLIGNRRWIARSRLTHQRHWLCTAPLVWEKVVNAKRPVHLFSFVRNCGQSRLWREDTLAFRLG